MGALAIDRTVEYQQAIIHLHHMYDTRHKIFQFSVVINAALLTIAFKMPELSLERVLMALMGFLITMFITLMAIRSNKYLKQVEVYTEELESFIGFGLINTTNKRMPKGIDSTSYFFYTYWAMILLWLFIITNFIIKYV